MHSESGINPFPPTHWSLVERAAQTDPDGRRKALDALLRLYLPALRAHLRIARRLSSSDADDLLQGFVADKVVESGLVGRADVAKGRFRSFLLVALDRYIVSQRRHDRAAKRGGNSAASHPVDLANAAAPNGEPSDAFDTAWAREIVAEAKRRMESACCGHGRADVWTVFTQHIATLPVKNPTGAARHSKKESNLLVTAKRAFRRAVRSVIADYVRDEHEIDDEIRDLKRALARVGA
jgi:RNA polymerase sigma-70 factor (ECF subfamily)